MEISFVYQDICLLPQSVITPRGYELPVNFPFCCQKHTSMYERAQRCLERFPNCCADHRKLAKLPGFSIKNYEGVALDIVKKSIYTERHLCQCVESENWFEDITDYMEYIMLSLGSYTVGAQVYYDHLKTYIESRKIDMGSGRAERLIDYIDGLLASTELAAKPIDLNIIYTTYQRWLTSFPFELGLFRGIQEQFARNLPLFTEEPVYNSYTRAYKARLITKKQLVEWLVERTRQLLSAINSPESIKARYRNDVEQKRGELRDERHRIRQARLVNEYSKGELQYVAIVKKWLKNEQEFIQEIIDLPVTSNQSTALDASAEVRPQPENTFNRMPLAKVEDWFMQFATTTSNNGKPFLTQAQVKQFIERAFLENSDTPMLHINFGSKEKLAVWKLFYQYYQHCVSYEGGIEQTTQCQEKYILLLTDNFDNFTFDEVKANFAKSNQVKAEWKVPH